MASRICSHKTLNQNADTGDGPPLRLVYLARLKTDGLQRRERHVTFVGELS